MALKKFKSKRVTGLTPLSRVRSAVVLIDAEASDSDDCKGAVAAYFRKKNISVSFLFTDFRKVESSDKLITSVAGTVLKKDLNWYERPSGEKISFINSIGADIFISLSGKNDFPSVFISNCIPAAFKVGRNDLPVYDLVMEGCEEKSQREVFGLICNILEKIQ